MVFIGSEDLLKRRLEMLKIDEDDESVQTFDKLWKKKKQEAKHSIALSESLAKSRYKDTENGDEVQENEDNESNVDDKRLGKYNKVISLDSKVHGSLIQSKLI